MASAVAANNQTRSQNRNLQAMQTAKEGAYRTGMDRQEGYAGEAGKAFAPMVEGQGATSFSNRQAADAASRMKAFTGAASPAQDYSFMGNAPNVTAAREQEFRDSDARTTRSNAALATLSGYGGADFGAGLDRNNYSRAFGNLSDRAVRDSNLIGMDMGQASSKAFKPANSALGALNTMGKLMTMYGAAGTPGVNYGTMPAPSQSFVGPMPQGWQFGSGVR